jgi:saccharopine dehydrogenase-like NADP-dependent oxidoreductase
MAKTNLALVGAGKIGGAIVALLEQAGDYRITIIDQDARQLAAFRAAGHRIHVASLETADELARLLEGHDVVVSAAPFFLTPLIARAARLARVHYFDLTEDVESTRVVMGLAEGAKSAFVPQCGLAPGFISIVAHDLAQRFDRLRDVYMRVGALPTYPNNTLKYNLTWSTDGLINEYCNPCQSIRDGLPMDTLPLEEVESFSLDGVDYEAFNTSGGLGTLAETLEGRVENLNYKTVRYPGHRDIVKTLVRDLRLDRRRDLLKDVLEAAIPMTKQDVVLVYVSVTGEREGRLQQEVFAKKIYAREIDGRLFSAIQVTTAAGICAMVDLLIEGKLPATGFVRQEQAPLAAFLANRFGSYYA